MIIANEPTFYTHWDLDKNDQDFYLSPTVSRTLYLEAIEKKKRLIKDHQLVIIDHGTAEEMGIQVFHNYLATLKHLTFQHIAQGCVYQWVSA